MLENYARCTYLFQSPRSGKFVSNFQEIQLPKVEFLFQSPRSGKFVSDLLITEVGSIVAEGKEFQSPRSGKIVSDANEKTRIYKNFSPKVSIP